MPPGATAIAVLAALRCCTHPRQVVNRTGSQQHLPVGRASGVSEGAGCEQQLGTLLHQQQPARAGGPELFANQSIRLAAAGYRHLAVMAEDGCGYGIYGQLGLSDSF